MADIKKMAKIWDFKDKVYHDYELPEGAKLISYDTEEVISCASCGKEMKFGEGYTSLRIHTSMGLGYAVCEDCYCEEIKIERGNDYE